MSYRIKSSMALGVSAAALAFIATPAAAQNQEGQPIEERKAVTIPAGTLSDALSAVTDTFGVPVSAAPTLVEGKDAPEVSGAQDAESALDRLLVGSGLFAVADGSGGYLVISKQAALRPAPSTRMAQADTGEVVNTPPPAATPPNAVEEVQVAERTAADDGDIVVTGTRIRRDEYTSPTPLQIFDTEQARRVGIATVADLLQQSTVASGVQIDATTTDGGLPLETPPTGGTGTASIDLRGLGPERTLVLLNGRRLGSGASRGAPSQPDINLIPIGLVERVEVITEGASSIYGADAVAGVVNVILKDEFEGLEVSSLVKLPEADGGEAVQLSLVAGAASDRARITLGVDYYNQDRVRTGDRSFTRAQRSLSVGEDGTLFNFESDSFFDNSVFVSDGVTDDQGNNVGFIYYTPGSTNLGVPNFSSAFGLPEPDGPCTFNDTQTGSYACFDSLNNQDERRATDLIQPINRFSAMAIGSYDLDLFSAEEIYFEALYLNRNQRVRNAPEQIFPDVPGMIPILDSDGVQVGTTDNPLNPFDSDVSVIVSLADIGQDVDVELQQFRFVGGIRGGLGNSGFFADRDWRYDLSFSYDRGVGFQSQRILFEPALVQSTAGVFQDADTGEIRCGRPFPVGLFGFDTLPECVPFNLFAPSIFEARGDQGSVATQEEFDYLTGLRTNRSVVEQTMVQGFLSGDLFDIPIGGTAKFVLGAEYRLDSIETQNSIVGVQGLNASEGPGQEGQTIGSRSITEIYGELDLPIVVGRPGIEFLGIDGALRYTDEEFFGDEFTYRIRARYEPVDFLSISGSYGTSFRAPNLREQFLADQGGLSTFDPCLSSRVTDPTSVEQQFLIANCVADGVVFTDTDGDGLLDSTPLGTEGGQGYPVALGGSQDLLPETSRSYTGTIAFSQPFSSAFDFDVAVSYFDIEVSNAVRELAPNTIVSQCYTNLEFPNLSSPFCDRFDRRGAAVASQTFIESVNASFINVGEETVRGLDIVTRLGFDFQDVISSDLPPIRFDWQTATSHLIEQEVEILSPEDRDDNAGEIGFARWRFNSNVSLGYDDFVLAFRSRFISGTEADLSFNPTRVATDIEGSPTVTLITAVDDQWLHDASLTWERDRASFTLGVSNLFDTEPPLIATGGPNRSNAVTSSGYDFFGRSFFVAGRLGF